MGWHPLTSGLNRSSGPQDEFPNPPKGIRLKLGSSPLSTFAFPAEPLNAIRWLNCVMRPRGDRPYVRTISPSTLHAAVTTQQAETVGRVIASLLDMFYAR